jgi:uncharacterized Tic20 family protein
MDEQPLSSSTRSRAAKCHLAGLVWLPISVALLILTLKANQDLGLFSIIFFAYPLFGMALGSLLAISIWKAIRAMHPFLDRSGRSAVNFVLSYNLYLLIMSTFLGITCGVTRASSTLAPLIGGLCGLFGILLIGHLCATIDRAIAAWNGRVPNYPLVIKFLADIQ